MARFVGGIAGSQILIFAVVVASVTILNLVGPTNAVQTKLDSINVDKYLENTPLVEEHMRCLIYSGPCDAIANEIKIKYTGITTTRCGVCTPEQEQKLNKIAQHWQQHYPLAWRELTNFISQG